MNSREGFAPAQGLVEHRQDPKPAPKGEPCLKEDDEKVTKSDLLREVVKRGLHVKR